ncbi:MAG: DNA primase [Sandaracinaceae bacterium]|jgi:DNA primase|nr:DNA primase [Sandaracinaceae bacterium]
MIPDDKIAEVREHTDVVALIGEVVRLKRAGTSFKGLCPFHNEKTPSFTVTPARQFFHCFGCGASGDAIAFVMKLEGRTFVEAIRTLAERAGIELPKEDTQEAAQERQARARRERLVAIMEAATAYYEKELEQHALADMAREEYRKRSITEESAKAFRFGYAPAGWDGLAKYLANAGWGPSECEELGLIVPRKKGDGYYDRFRHRLMFPIIDVHGHVIAFSGRLLPTPPGQPEPKDGEAGAKYVNSPESPLYKKGETLFGLYQGRVSLRRQGLAMICEGNFDLVALHQAGFDNSVAPMGTALTGTQAKLLRRFADKVVLMFDGDNAGKKATRAAFPILREAGIQTKVVTLPPGEDPDGFLRTKGPEALKGLIGTAPGIVEHLIDEAADLSAGDPGAKAAAIESLGPIIGALDNRVEATLYVEKVAQRFGISDVAGVRQLLTRGYRRNRTSQGRFPDTHPQKPEMPVQRPPAKIVVPPLESELLGAILDRTELIDTEEAKKVEELLTSPELRAIFSAARRAIVRGAVDATALLALIEGNPLVGWLKERLAFEKYDVETARAVLRDGLPRLWASHLSNELAEVKKQVLMATRQGQEDEANGLRERINQLHRELAGLQGNQR